uniref:Uncharacterized protein n=1 Tax=Anguilla anguilla TaxID=7936 RepID=A0A0E9UKA1_ANGAN
MCLFRNTKNKTFYSNIAHFDFRTIRQINPF